MAMKLLKLLFILSITTSIVGAARSADGNNEDSTVETHLALPESPESYIALPESPESYISLPESPESYIALPGSEEKTSSDGTSDFNDFRLQRKNMTCDKYPQICRQKSSPGPDCCKRKCVNVMKDPINCGKCGHKCKHNEICCKGRCVNPSCDPLNCGKCGKKCKKWETCVYGMCSYA